MASAPLEVALHSWCPYAPGVDLDRRNQWLRCVLDLCVLALLGRGESYGYELGQALERAGPQVLPDHRCRPRALRERRGREPVWSGIAYQTGRPDAPAGRGHPQRFGQR
jgi:hypothetical protein